MKNPFRHMRAHAAIFLSLPILLIAQNTPAAAVSKPILLWPNGAPGDNSPIGPEHDLPPAKKPAPGQKGVIRLTDVSQPDLTIYRPSRFKANGAAVIVCPGGGFKFLSMDLEGTEICRWLNSIGVTGALLKYRVPERTGDSRHILPLEDAQRAMGILRSRAREWNLDTNRIGIMGFSAGARVTAQLCNNFERRAYPAVDDTGRLSCRPDFAMIIYPGALVKKDGKFTLEPELSVTSNTPPTFLVQAEDDPVRVENSIYYYLALKNAHVPAEIHLYAKGGHGYGLRPSKNPVSQWPKRAEDWLRSRGILEKKKY